MDPLWTHHYMVCAIPYTMCTPCVCMMHTPPLPYGYMGHTGTWGHGVMPLMVRGMGWHTITTTTSTIRYPLITGVLRMGTPKWRDM